MRELYKLRHAVRTHFDLTRFDHPTAVTLTMKQGRSSYHLGRWLNSSKNLRHFLNVLNKKCYGKKGEHKKLIACYAVLEGHWDIDTKLHYHLCLDRPAHLTLNDFTSLINEIWIKTRLGYPETCIQECDDGWIDYITKLRTKLDFADSIDWTNCYNKAEYAV